MRHCPRNTITVTATVMFTILLILLGQIVSAEWATSLKVTKKATIFSRPGFSFENWEAHKGEVERLGFPDAGTVLPIQTDFSPEQMRQVGDRSGKVGTYFPVVIKKDGKDTLGWVEASYVKAMNIAPKSCSQRKSCFSVLETTVPEILDKAKSSFPYDTCSSKNDYFEAKLKNAPFVDMPLMDSPPPACTFEILKAGSSANMSRMRCDAITRTRDKPACLSAAHHKAIHNSFAAATRCMDLDPRPLLAKYGAESKFQLDAKSSSGAAGAGQLVYNWIKDVNTTYREPYLSELRNNKDPVCQKLYQEVSRHKLLPKSDCSAVEPPQNPLLSFFYGLILVKQAQRDMAGTVFKWAGIKDSADVAAVRAEALGLERKKMNLNQEATKLQRGEVKSERSRITGEIEKIDEQLNQIYLFRLPEARLRQVRENTETQKIISEASLYAYNVGKGGMAVYLGTFLAEKRNRGIDFAKFSGANGQFIKFLAAKMNDEFESRNRNDKSRTERQKSEERKRMEEILNYVHTFDRRGTGGHDSISKQMKLLNDSASREYGLEGSEPCAGF